MAEVLFNPTNERFETQYIGEVVVIPSYPEEGHILKVDSARARHVLNVLSPRGLCVLNYGDSEQKKEEIAKAGRERNKAFKRKMVIQFNQQNEANKQRTLPYLVPTEQLTSYADELGIALLQPYTVESDTQEKIGSLVQEINAKDEKIKIQDRQVEDLQSQVSALSEQVKNLINTFTQPTEDAVENIDEDEMLKFRTLNRAHFKKWLAKNSENIEDYPENIQDEIDKRHIKLLGEPYFADHE